MNQHAGVGEGNQQDTLHFETLGGQLSVQSMSSETSSLPTIQITLPKSDSSMQLPNGLKLSNESLKVYPTGACHAVQSKCIMCLLLLLFCSVRTVQSECCKLQSIHHPYPEHMATVTVHLLHLSMPLMLQALSFSNEQCNEQ